MVEAQRQKNLGPKGIASGIEILTLPEYKQELERSLSGDDEAIRHVLLQARQFEPGEKVGRIFEALMRTNAQLTIVNVDASARKGYETDFSPRVGSNGHRVHVNYTRSQFASWPFIGHYIGRNHIRMVLVNETAYISTLDFAERCFERDELIYKITQPELVQIMKIVALWNYEKQQPEYRVKAGGIQVLFDTGKDSGGYISRYTESEIVARAGKDSSMWVSSSWFPDELNQAIEWAVGQGCAVNLLLNRPDEFESIKKLPFTLTKMAAWNTFRGQTWAEQCRVFYPSQKVTHAKFVLITGSNGENWWIAGTSNHSRFGSMARTAEIGLAGTNLEIAEQLLSYIDSVPKTKLPT